MTPKTMTIRATIAAILCTASIAAHAVADTPKPIAIPAGDLTTALEMIAKQADVELIFQPDQLKGLRTKGLTGTMTSQEAVKKLLEGTTLQLRTDATNGAMMIGPTPTATPSEKPKTTADDTRASAKEGRLGGESFWSRFRLAQAGEGSTSTAGAVGTGDKVEEYEPTAGKAIPEILVRGSNSLNTDIRRTEDDIQPYVVFNKEQITRSQASNLEDFVKTQLPMNTTSGTLQQLSDRPSATGGVLNLRGLGSGQTLILIDGRRISSTSALGGGLGQTNISGIPLSSVERIEVLPATSGGIYGGSATGGVINIIRKKDFNGLEAQVKYGNTFASDAQSAEVDLSGGISFEEGRSHMMFSFRRSESDALLVNERDFARESRDLLLKTNPSALSEAFQPPIARTSNVCAGDAFSVAFGACNGQPLTLDDGTPVGGSFTSVPTGYSGPVGDGGRALIAGAGKYDLSIPLDGQYLLRAPTDTAFSASWTRVFDRGFEAYIDASSFRSKSDLSTGDTSLIVTVPADAPNNPFQQDILVNVADTGTDRPAFSRNDLVQVAGGVIYRLSQNWALTLDQNWSRTRASYQETDGPVLTEDGLLFLQSNALRDLRAHPIDLSPYMTKTPDTFGGPFESTLAATAFRISGPVLDLPAGPLNLSALVERRKERARRSFLSDLTGLSFGFDPSVTLYPERSQIVRSFYIESRIPLIAPAQNLHFGDTLDLQVAARRDDYETRSTSNVSTASSIDGPFAAPSYTTNKVSSTDYTLGLRFSPVKGFTLRTSYGTGFLPPGLNQIVPTRSTANFTNGVTDPRRGGSLINIPYTRISGGNSNLDPELSRSWSAGVIFEPGFATGLRLSVDYTEIKKTDEIFTPTLQFIIDNEAIFSDRLVRGAKLPSDPADWAGPITQADSSYVNFASSKVEAYDFNVGYVHSTSRLGSISFGLLASRMKLLSRQAAQTLAPYDSVGYADGPLAWRGKAELQWARGPWMVGWSGEYYDSYRFAYANPTVQFLNGDRLLNQGSSTIPRQLYHNFLVQRGFDSLFASDLTVTLGIQNAFNKSPPILATQGLVDSLGSNNYSVYGDPRLRRYSLSVRKAFAW